MTRYKQWERFDEAYITRAVEYAVSINKKNGKSIKLLDLCSGAARKLTEILVRLKSNRIPFQATLVDFNYILMQRAWEHLKERDSTRNVNFAYRDVTKINNPNGYLGDPNFRPESIDLAEGRTNLPVYSASYRFKPESIDLVVGVIPFSSLLSDPTIDTYEAAINSVAPLVKKEGAVIFTTGYSRSSVDNLKLRWIYNQLRRLERAVLEEGIKHPRLDELFEKHDLVRTRRVDTYASEGALPFEHFELLVYQRK